MSDMTPVSARIVVATAEDRLRLRVGASILSFVLFATFIVALRPGA